MKNLKFFILILSFPFVLINCDGCNKQTQSFDADPELEGGSSSGGSASAGDSGSSGSSGDTGGSASTGDSGSSGSSGDTGGSASTGDSGSSGTSGDTGGSASTGDSGSSGSDTGSPFNIIDTFPHGGIIHGGSSSGGESGESGSTTGGSTGSDTTSEKIDWRILGLWRGLQMEFTDGVCQNHKIYKLGQKISSSYAAENDHYYSLEITQKTTVQDHSKEKKSNNYKYKTHYTSLAYNPEYMSIQEGSISLTSNNKKTNTISLDSFELVNENYMEAHVLLQGFMITLDENIEPDSFSIGLSIDWINSNELEITVSPDVSPNVGFDLTVYYMVILNDPEHIWVSNNKFEIDEDLTVHSELLYSDCDSDYCSYTYGVEENSGSYKYFAGLTSWGFSNGVSAEFRKLRGITKTNNEKTTIAGEIKHEKCGINDEKVSPLDKIKAMTFVCIDKYACRSNQMDFTTWDEVNVDESDETTTSKDIVEGWYFETPPED